MREAETARRKREEGDEGKTVTKGAEPALLLRFGIVVVAGKSWAAERGKAEGRGRGERGSGGAGGERRFWQTGDGVEGEEEETGSW